MSRLLYVVVATEDDYYPDIRAIGVFETEESAQAYADAQPRCVYPFSHNQYYARDHKAWYSYSVETLPVEPMEPWAKAAE